MDRKFLLRAGLIAALGGIPAGARGTAAAPLDSPQHRLVLGEIGLELELKAAEREQGWVLPVPDPPGAPRMDGDLSEPFWSGASVLRWETAGDSLFLDGTVWRIFLARAEGALCLAGERLGSLQSVEVLTLDRSARERLTVRLDPGGEVTARAEAPGATGPLTAYGAAFAGRIGPDGASWELRLPPGFRPWPADGFPLGPLRLTSSRGRPATVRVSPPFRLEVDEVALRMLAMTSRAERVVELVVELVNPTARPLAVELSPKERAVLSPRSRTSFRSVHSPPAGEHSVGAAFQLSGRAVPYRVGAATIFPDPVVLEAESREALDLAASTLARIDAPDPGLSAEIGRARAELSARRDPRSAEDLYLRSRMLRRRVVFAALPPELDRILVARRFHDRAGPYYATYLQDMPGGGLSIASIRSGEDREVVSSPPGAGVRDPCLSLDGRRVAFSMRRSGAGTNLFLADLEGGEPRPITAGPHHDLQPCWLPGGEILFTSTRAGSRNPLNPADNLCFHRVREDGTGLQRISSNYLLDFTPSLLPDGRVVFLRWVHEDKPGNFINALWTMGPDGSALAGLFGMNHPGVLSEPRAIPGTGRFVCLDSGPLGQWRDPQVGDLGVFDVNVDPNGFLYSIRAPRGGFKDPFPVGPDAFLASLGAPDTRWAIYLVDALGNREPVYRDPELSAFRPLPLLSRPAPPRLAPGGHGEGGVLKDSATLTVEDVYQGLPGVPRGTVTRLRVVAVPDRPRVEMQGFQDQTVPIGIATRMVRRVLGTVPVHPDGSAHFEAPAGKSLFFQLLDADGTVVKTMRDTIAFSPGEHRSCIGCHEPRSLAPPPSSRGRSLALDAPPAAIEPEPGPAAISFPADLQPILDRRCVRCHDASDPAGGVALSGDQTPFFNLAYETLTRGWPNSNFQDWGEKLPGASEPFAAANPYVTEPVPPRAGGSRSSRLYRLVAGKHGGVELPAEERSLLWRWIDLNLPYYDDWETARGGAIPPQPTQGGGERRLLPPIAERALSTLLRAQCRGCHAAPDLFRGAVLNLGRPALSVLLRAPLSKAAGGLGVCGGGVFESPADPAYRAMLEAISSAGAVSGAGSGGAAGGDAPAGGAATAKDPVLSAATAPKPTAGGGAEDFAVPPRSSAFTAAPSSACGSCHPRQFREWASSVHAYALRPPSFLTAAAPSARFGVLEDRVCAGCHGSLDRLLGKSFPPDHPLDLAHAAEVTVSCTTCHQIGGEHARSREPGGRCFPEGRERPMIDVPFHRSKTSAALRRAETCGPCHDVRTPAGVPIERTFSQYLASVYPERVILCATCHLKSMTGRMVPDGPLRYQLRRHDMIGVDTGAEAVPEAGPQLERVLAFLRPALLVSLRAPGEAEAGRELELALDLKNVGAGHNFPAGPAGERRMWLEVTAWAGGGGAAPFWVSGAPGPDGEPAGDPQLVELADRLLDESGNEVEDPLAAARVEERSLRAMETRRASYRIPVGEELRGGTLRLRVRVLFRAARAEVLRKRGLAGISGRFPILEVWSGEADPIRVVEREAGSETVRVPEDFPDVLQALAAVRSGGTVLVAPGEYAVDRPLELGSRGVALRSRRGAAETVLRMSDRPLDPDRASVVAFSGGPAGGAADRLAGFTIEGGRGTRLEGRRSGGGILCVDARAVIEDVVVRGNSAADGDGGGIHALRSRLVLSGARVVRNEAGGSGGGLAIDRSEVLVARTVFAGNSAKRGGAVAASGSSLALEELAAQGNWSEKGGGLSFFAEREGGSISLDRSRILGNISGQGGGMEIAGPLSLSIRKTLLAGNGADRGGALAVSGGARVALEFVTITQNAALGGGVVTGGGPRGVAAGAQEGRGAGPRAGGVTIKNSIVWGNRPAATSGRVERSIVDDERHRGGTNSVSVPIFEAAEGEWVDCAEPLADECVPVGEAGSTPEARRWKRWIPGDYRPVGGSPVVDAGDPGSPSDPDGTRADLGAFPLPQPGHAFVRGDLDGDGRVGGADLAVLLRHLLDQRPFPCADAADLDDSGRVSPLDALLLAARALGLGFPPPPPFPDCGTDPTADDGLGCFESSKACR
jgi:predicted outer membrane repeat protein